jgi:hypothetical protein
MPNSGIIREKPQYWTVYGIEFTSLAIERLQRNIGKQNTLAIVWGVFNFWL